MLRNPLHFVSIHDVEVIGDNVVLITVNLASHVSLTEEVVRVGMNAFVAQYHPRITHWEAHAVERVDGSWLYVKVHGNINPEAIEKYRR